MSLSMNSIYLKRFCLVLTAALTLLAHSAMAQVAPSAFRRVSTIWVGGEYSNMHASFPYQTDQRLWGLGGFASFNWNQYLGVEGDARYLHFGGYNGETEKTYMAGPRFLFPQWHRLQPYVKTLVGVGKIQYPFNIGDGSYLAVAPGGGVNYRVNYRWAIRGEYEYQLWPNSPGFSNEPNHELTPNGFQIGVAFRAFR